MPRRIQPLTAKRLDAVRPRDAEVIELGDGLLPGLRVRISRGGRYWSLNIRNPDLCLDSTIFSMDEVRRHTP